MSGDDDPLGNFMYNLAGQSSPSEEDQIDPELQTIEDNHNAQAYANLHGMRPQGLPLHTAPAPAPEGLHMPPNMESTLRALNRITLHIDQSPRVGQVNTVRGGPPKDLKPMDPPCIARITIERDPSGTAIDTINGIPLLDNPKLFCSAQLELAPGEQPYEANTYIQPVVDRLKGNRTSSVHCVEAPNGYTKCFFIFRDLTVLECGIYRLKLTLHCNLDGLGGFDHYQMAEAYTEPFEIFPKRTFPGYGASTELTDWLSGQGTKLTKRADSKKVALAKKNEEIARKLDANRRQQGIIDEDASGLTNGSTTEFDTAPAVGTTALQITQSASTKVAAKKARGRPKRQKVEHKQEQASTSNLPVVSTAPQQSNSDMSQSQANEIAPKTFESPAFPVNMEFTNGTVPAFTNVVGFSNVSALTNGANEGFIPTLNVNQNNFMGDSSMPHDSMFAEPMVDENCTANYPMQYPYSPQQNFMHQEVQSVQPSQLMLSHGDQPATDSKSQDITWSKDHVNNDPCLDHIAHTWLQDQQPWTFDDTFVYDQQ